jgi:hypothetical protein
MIKVGKINLYLLLVGVALAICAGLSDDASIIPIGIGIALLLLCIGNFIIGAFFLFAALFDKSNAGMGAAMMCYAALSLLFSFTLCSTGMGRGFL